MSEDNFSVFGRTDELMKKRKKGPGVLFFIILFSIIGMVYGIFSSGIVDIGVLPEKKVAVEQKTPEDIENPVNEEVLPPEEDTEEEVEAETVYPEPTKTAYLTFSSGPSGQTISILDVLKENDIKATFFVTGNAVSNNKDAILKMYQDGHSIGVQSYSGSASSMLASEDSFRIELSKSANAIRSVVGEDYDVKVFRYLSTSADKTLFNSILSSLNIRPVAWNCLLGDDKASVNVSPQSLYDYFFESLSYASDKDEIVILCNDSSNSKYTAEALKLVINQLRNQGYAFKTL